MEMSSYIPTLLIIGCIKFPDNVQEKFYAYLVSDMSGREVMSGEIDITTPIIDTSRLDDGMYVIYVKGGQQVYRRSRFVKE